MGVSNALSTRLANIAVALAGVLGSRTAEMSVMHITIIRGLRASRLVYVRY